MPSNVPHDVRVALARPHLGWWILGVAFLLVLAAIAQRYLGWLVFGLFVYYVARPVTRRIETRVASRSLAAAATLLLIVVPVVALLASLLLVALGQFTALLASAPVQPILDQLPFQIPTLPTNPDDFVHTTVVLIQDPSVQTALTQLSGVVGAVGATLYNMFVSLLLAFFLLVSDRRIAAWFSAEVFDGRPLATEYLRVVDSGLKSVYFGYTMTIFVIMILTSIIYTLFNVFAPGSLTIPSAVLLGVITGVFTLVPLVGRSIVYFLIAAVLGIQAVTTQPTLLWYPIVFLVVMMVVFDNVVRTYIRPYLSGRMLSTGLVMFAYLLGPPFFGWYGIFLGPLLLVFIVTFVRLILPVLANPEREQVPVPADQTLDQFGWKPHPEPEDSPTEPDHGDVRPG